MFGPLVCLIASLVLAWRRRDVYRYVDEMMQTLGSNSPSDSTPHDAAPAQGAVGQKDTAQFDLAEAIDYNPG